MNKTILDRFISKYNLAGSVEAVVFKTEKNKLSTKAITDDKSALCIVSAEGVKVDDGEYPIYGTSQLKSLLGVLGDDITVTVQKANNDPKSLLIADSSTKATFVLADKNVIPNVPDLKKLPPFPIEIKLDEKFVHTFIKAKGALADVDTFTVLSDGKDATVVIGYSSLNTNRVTINTETTANDKITPISFSAKYLKDILSANRDATNGTMKVSPQGLAHVSFTIDGFTADYYLVQVDTAS